MFPYGPSPSFSIPLPTPTRRTRSSPWAWERDRFLIKPMKPDQLLTAIKEVRERPYEDGEKEIARQNDPTVLKEYNEILFHKLEKKVMELENDIAERKAAEKALRESEERFRKVFESGAVGIAIIDLSGKVTRVNEELCGMLGYADTELMGMDLLDMGPSRPPSGPQREQPTDEGGRHASLHHAGTLPAEGRLYRLVTVKDVYN